MLRHTRRACNYVLPSSRKVGPVVGTPHACFLHACTHIPVQWHAHCAFRVLTSFPSAPTMVPSAAAPPLSSSWPCANTITLPSSCLPQVENFPSVPTMVLTATATPRVKQDIVSSLIIPRCRYFQVNLCSTAQEVAWSALLPSAAARHQTTSCLSQRTAAHLALYSICVLAASDSMTNPDGGYICMLRGSLHSLHTPLSSQDSSL